MFETPDVGQQWRETLNKTVSVKTTASKSESATNNEQRQVFVIHFNSFSPFRQVCFHSYETDFGQEYVNNEW